MTGDNGITAVKVWDVSLKGNAEWANLPALPSYFRNAAFTADGRSIVASSAAGPASVWDAETGELVTTLRPDGSISAIDPLLSQPSGSDVLAIAASPDGDLIATAGADGVTRLWDITTGTETATLGAAEPAGVQPLPPSAVHGLAWSSDGEFLATVGFKDGRGVVRVVDRDGAPVAELDDDPGIEVTSVAFNPDGRLLATTRAPLDRFDPRFDGLKVWDWRSDEAVTTITTPASRVVFDPSGERIASSSGEGVAKVWDVRTGDELATLEGHTGRVLDVAFSPDGASIATAGADGTVRLWDADGGSQPLVLRGHRLAVGTVVFSPDGSKLASVSFDGTARVWALDLDDLIDIATSKLTRTLTHEECRQFLHVDSCP
jgi:WD40 repeat protein